MRVDLRGDAEAPRHVRNGAEADFLPSLAATVLIE
jgi:hypothetical protein